MSKIQRNGKKPINKTGASAAAQDVFSPTGEKKGRRIRGKTEGKRTLGEQESALSQTLQVLGPKGLGTEGKGFSTGGRFGKGKWQKARKLKKKTVRISALQEASY